MKRTVLLIVFYSFLIAASAQMLPYHRYTSKDGLIADRITAIQQDDRGVMWFGSFFGLCYYDGINFHKVHLPAEQENKFVTCILPASKKIYAGFLFEGGLAEWSEGNVKAYSFHSIDSNTSNNVFAICRLDDSSIVAVNGSNNVYRFCNGRFTLLYSLHDQINNYVTQQVLIDEKKNIWVGTEDGLYIISADRRRSPLHLYAGFKVVSLLRSQDGTIWFAISNESVGAAFTCNGFENGAIKNMQQVMNLPRLWAPGFTGNMAGGFWAVHKEKGLFNLTSDGALKHFPSALDMKADVNALFADRENNLWIANDPGLIKISSFSSVSWYFNEGAAAGGHILRDKGGNIWVSNSKELYRIRNDSMREMPFRGNEGGYIGKMLLDSIGNIWMVRWNEGIWKTTWGPDRLKEKKYFNSYRGDKLIGAGLVKDSLGTIWFSGPLGIYRMKNDKVIDHYTPISFNGDTLFIIGIVLDYKHKTMWLGDNARGLFKVELSRINEQRYHYKLSAAIASNEGLKDTYIRSMLLDHSGNLWLGTRAGGIFRVRTQDSTPHAEAVFPPGGISCSRITGIVEERDKAVWFATCDGIYRLDQHSGGWRHINVSNGLLSNEVFHIYQDSAKQQIWALTELGVTRIDLNIEDDKPISPIVHFTQINVLGKPDTTSLYSDHLIKYEYARNSIGFVFAASSFFNEKNNRYKYMLEGYDKQWSDAVNTNAVNYASLPPGMYTFKVIAESAKGIWSSQPASFSFQIILPFYRRPWFIFACFLFAGAIFYLLRFARLKQQYEVEKVRLRIARDLHDDIGSALGSINLMSETANRRLTKSIAAPEVTEVFNKIGHSAQTTLESMDDIVWSINPDKDKVGDLLVRMREFAIPLLEAREIKFEFKVNAADYRKLPMNLRKNIFLIFKEAIFNIIKHAGSTQVEIITEIKNSQFFLCVKDNGKGFDPFQASTRNGLKNMQKRADLVDGKLLIQSLPALGTSIRFSCLIK